MLDNNVSLTDAVMQTRKRRDEEDQNVMDDKTQTDCEDNIKPSEDSAEADR